MRPLCYEMTVNQLTHRFCSIELEHVHPALGFINQCTKPTAGLKDRHYLIPIQLTIWPIFHSITVAIFPLSAVAFFFYTQFRCCCGLNAMDFPLLFSINIVFIEYKTVCVRFPLYSKMLWTDLAHNIELNTQSSFFLKDFFPLFLNIECKYLNSLMDFLSS